MAESKEKRITSFLSRTKASGEPVCLRGDASTRSFYRVNLDSGPAVMMVLAEPQPEGEHSYISVRNHLAACDVAVPEIYDYDSSNGIILMEDFGDVTLEERLRGADEETFRRYYHIAIDELLKIQILGTTLPSDCPAFHRAFDEEKLMQELDLFLEYTAVGVYKAKFESGEREAIRNSFADLVKTLASLPRVFNHRDYHSRNLMVMDDSIRVVDFQDARMGPCQYDLVSLLRDSYTVLSNPFRRGMIDYYLGRSREDGVDWFDREDFMYRFELMGLQRNLKACGTFGYMAAVRGDNRYLKYLEPTFAYIRENAGGLEEVSTCVNLLARYVPSLR